MRKYRCNIYKADDGFVGNAREIAEHFDVDKKQVYMAVSKKYKLCGNTIVCIENRLEKKYGVYVGDKLDFTGTLTEIVDKYFFSRQAVIRSYLYKRKLSRTYEVKDL